jgi:diketogulonate reductase-like aldo/keto reductase
MARTKQPTPRHLSTDERTARHSTWHRRQKSRSRRRIRRLAWPPPPLCFGLVHHGREDAALPHFARLIQTAYEMGYRHFDGADSYASGCVGYCACLRQAFRQLPRAKIWITWKGDDVDRIPAMLDKLGLAYFDVYLIHHGCGHPMMWKALATHVRQGRIRWFGVSNCEDLAILRTLRTQHPKYARVLQIQARAEDNFIAEYNALGFVVMLFAIHSGVLNAMQVDHSDVIQRMDMLLPWYLQRYIRGTHNIVIVGAQWGEHLASNVETWRRFAGPQASEAWSAARMQEMKTWLQNIKLSRQ